MAGIQAEQYEQQALFEWAGLMATRWPELVLLYHIPNGGMRNKIEAAKLKAAGVKPGVPDLCLPVARGGYHGMYIELKRLEGGRLSQAQSDWMTALEQQGYHAVRCNGWGEAADEIERYITGREKREDA